MEDSDLSDQEDEMTGLHKQHMQQIEGELEESDIDSEATDVSTDWVDTSSTGASKLVCSLSAQAGWNQDLSDVEEDLSPADAPLPDWSDSETESYLDTPSGSPQLGQTNGEQDQHQECSQEEEPGCAYDIVPDTTVSSEVGHKLRLRLKRDRKDGPEDNPEEREGKKGKTRMFSTYELEELEKAYKRDPYPDSSDKEYLATRLKISLKRVKVWFQNRRRKFQVSQMSSGEPGLKRKKRRSKDRDERGEKQKRERFSHDQVREMEKVFKQFPYPETHVRDDLAMRFKVKPDRVRVWFQHRRNKWKTGEKPRTKSTRAKRLPPKPSAVPGPTTSCAVFKKRRCSSKSSSGPSPPPSSSSSYPSNVNSHHPNRTTLSDDQLRELEAAFQVDPYLPRVDREKLAKRVNLQQKKLEIWFNNRRAKWRKTGKRKLNGPALRGPRPKRPDTTSETANGSSQSAQLTRKRKNSAPDEHGKATGGKKLTRELRNLLPHSDEKPHQTVETLLEDMLVGTKPRQPKPLNSTRPNEATVTVAADTKKGSARSSKSSTSSSSSSTSSSKNNNNNDRKTGPTPSSEQKDSSCNRQMALPGTQEEDAVIVGENVFLRPEGENDDDKDLMRKRSSSCYERFFIKRAVINEACPDLYKYTPCSTALPRKYCPHNWQEEKWYYEETITYSYLKIKEDDRDYLQVKVVKLQKVKDLPQIVKWMPGDCESVPPLQWNNDAAKSKQPSRTAGSSQEQHSARHHSSTETPSEIPGNTDKKGQHSAVTDRRQPSRAAVSSDSNGQQRVRDHSSPDTPSASHGNTDKKGQHSAVTDNRQPSSASVFSDNNGQHNARQHSSPETPSASPGNTDKKGQHCDRRQPSTAAVSSDSNGQHRARDGSSPETLSTNPENAVVCLDDTSTDSEVIPLSPSALDSDNERADIGEHPRECEETSPTRCPDTSTMLAEASSEDWEVTGTPCEYEESPSIPPMEDSGAAEPSAASPPTVTSTSASCLRNPRDWESPSRPWGVNVNTFRVYLQTLISYSLDPSFLDEIEREGDEYFLIALKTLDRKLREAKNQVKRRATFDPQFKAFVETYPYLYTESNGGMGNQTCQACLSHLQATQTVNLSGRPYSRATLSETMEKGSKEFAVCQFCGDLAQTFHKLHHLKYRLFRECKNEVKAVQRSKKTETDDETCRCIISDREWVSELHEDLEEFLCRAQQGGQ